MPDSRRTADLTIGELLKGLTPKQLWSLLAACFALLAGAFGLGTQFSSNPDKEFSPNPDKASSPNPDKDGDTTRADDADISSTFPKNQAIVKVAGYAFELEKCMKDPKEIVCDVWVTNSSQNRKTDFHGSYASAPSKLFDYYGNEYLASGVKLEGFFQPVYINNHFLHTGIRKKLSIFFSRFHPNMDRIKYLEIRGEDESVNAGFTARFNNVEITK